MASEAGGQGLHLVVAFQDLSPKRGPGGGEAADGFLTLFPEKLILSGMNDRSTADMLSKMSGDYDRMTVGVSQPGNSVNTSLACARAATTFSTNRGQPGYSYQTTRTPVLSIADIAGVPASQGLYYGPHGWSLLTLNPWWYQRQHLGL